MESKHRLGDVGKFGENITVCNPNAIEGQDYEFYCPISLDDEGKVNKNQPDYFVVMKRCQLPLREECRSTQTLEQALSPLTTGFMILESSTLK